MSNHKNKIKIGVLFGGKSAEHEVSIQSARNVINALDKKKYQVVPIKIPKNGRFNFSLIKKLDVVFPVMHGPFGEDGSMQGFLKLSQVPFVGAGVLGSAVGMDKDVMKRLLREAKLPVGSFKTFQSGDKINLSQIKRQFGMPLFVKPVNMGSSIGMTKVKSANELEGAINKAFKYDRKIIIEKNILAREVECAVIGNKTPIASVTGEIIISKRQEYFSYEAKYLDEELIVDVPAKIKKVEAEKIRKLAINAFRVLNCEGMARIDFFLQRNGKIFINEINTIPGPVMFRKLWENSNLPFPRLLDKLIDFAIERFKEEKKLKTTVN